MASTKCSNCGRKLTPFNRNPLSPDTHQNCDQVAKASRDDESMNQEVGSRIVPPIRMDSALPDLLPSSDKQISHEAKVAVQSARIVNTYGTLIQIFGIVFLFTNVASGYYLTHYSGNVGWVIGGVISGLVVLFLCAVQGALFRLISNYAVARLKG